MTIILNRNSLLITILFCSIICDIRNKKLLYMLMQNHFINEISGDSYWVRFVFRVPPSLSYGDSPVRLPAVHVTSPGASLNDELVHFQQSSASVFQRSNSDTIGRKTQTRLSPTNSPQERHRAICRAMCRTS